MKFVSLLFLFLAACTSKPKDPYTYFHGKAMETTYNIAIGKTLSSKEKKDIQTLLNHVFREADKTLSEIAQFNNLSIGTFTPSEKLLFLLHSSDKIVLLSGGRFDPTVEPLSRIWRKALNQKKMPDTTLVQQACEELSWSHLTLREKIIEKKRKGTCINLSGLVKGQSIDQIVERLQAQGYSDLFVQWGSASRAIGRQPNGKEWIVTINPSLQQEGHPLTPIPLRNAAIAVSGEFTTKGLILPAEAAPDHQVHRYFPIIDPLTAQPIEQTPYSIAAAAVIAPTCIYACALAKAAMIFSSRKEAENWAQEVVQLYPDVSFWILSHRDP